MWPMGLLFVLITLGTYHVHVNVSKFVQTKGHTPFKGGGGDYTNEIAKVPKSDQSRNTSRKYKSEK
jgi:hypothetical protein